MLLDHILLLLGDLDASLPYYDHLLPLIGFKKAKDHVWTSPEGLSLTFAKLLKSVRGTGATELD